MTCKWLITVVGKSPKDRVVGPLPNGRFISFHGLYMGITNHLY